MERTTDTWYPGRETFVTLWMFRTVIACSNGVDERWKGEMYGDSLVYSEVVPVRHPASVDQVGVLLAFLVYICWLAVCSFGVHRFAFFVVCLSSVNSPSPGTFISLPYVCGFPPSVDETAKRRKDIAIVLFGHSRSPTTALARHTHTYTVLYPS